MNFKKNVIAFNISREMALMFGLVEPTSEEAAQMAEDSARYRREEAERRAMPDPELTLDALLDSLGWSAAYATHRLHPACWCDPFGEDPWLCDFARDLGYEEIGGEPAPRVS